jgi:hypothetical protein
MENILNFTEVLNSIHQYKNLFWLGFTVIMIIYWIGVFITTYHLIRFGVGTLPKKVSAIFLGGSILLSVMTVLFFAGIFI